MSDRRGSSFDAFTMGAVRAVQQKPGMRGVDFDKDPGQCMALVQDHQNQGSDRMFDNAQRVTEQVDRMAKAHAQNAAGGGQTIQHAKASELGLLSPVEQALQRVTTFQPQTHDNYRSR